MPASSHQHQPDLTFRQETHHVRVLPSRNPERVPHDRRNEGRTVGKNAPSSGKVTRRPGIRHASELPPDQSHPGTPRTTHRRLDRRLEQYPHAPAGSGTHTKSPTNSSMSYCSPPPTAIAALRRVLPRLRNRRRYRLDRPHQTKSQTHQTWDRTPEHTRQRTTGRHNHGATDDTFSLRAYRATMAGSFQRPCSCTSACGAPRATMRRARPTRPL